MSTDLVRLLLVIVVINLTVQVNTRETKNAITDNKAFTKTKQSLLKHEVAAQAEHLDDKHDWKGVENVGDGKEFRRTYGRRLPAESFGSRTKAKSALNTSSSLKYPSDSTDPVKDVKLSNGIPERDDHDWKKRHTGHHKKTRLKARLLEDVNSLNQTLRRTHLYKPDKRHAGSDKKLTRLQNRDFFQRDHLYKDKRHGPYRKKASLRNKPFEITKLSNETAGKAHGHNRKSRSPQYTLAAFNRGLGLNPLGLQYPPHVTPLAYRTAPALQSLGQYRGLIPSTNGLPYNLQLARLLSLLQHRAQISGANGLATNAGLNPQNAGGITADVHVYKPAGRLKYNSIPATPNALQQELPGGQLGVPLLALNPLNSIAGTSDAFGDLSEDSNLDELGEDVEVLLTTCYK